MSTSLLVVEAGWSSTLQDLGRSGLAHLGIPPGGAVDLGLAGLVNRLVGNPETSVVIETCGGLKIEANGPVLVATSVERSPIFLRAGDSLTVPNGGDHLWQYLAVAGGVDAPPTLNSGSTDTLSGLGPDPLKSGDTIDVGVAPTSLVAVDVAPVAPLGDIARISVGPRHDWFDPDLVGGLVGARWKISTSSRIGVRLDGPTLARLVTQELQSEGLVRGAIQVPPDGKPVMMLADHPTTGGYPVLAVVHPEDVAMVAQHAPGSFVSFRQHT